MDNRQQKAYESEKIGCENKKADLNRFGKIYTPDVNSVTADNSYLSGKKRIFSSKNKSSAGLTADNKPLSFVIIAAICIITLIVATIDFTTVEGADYSCSVGYTGLRVKRVMEYFELDVTDGNGVYYSEEIASMVAAFQQENGLEATGEVDLTTWKAMGFTQSEWNNCGAYHSKKRVTILTSRKQKIDKMIYRAYDYIGDPYVVGASGPAGEEYGVDCSGLVIQSLYAAGVIMDEITPVTHASPGHEFESRSIWESDYFTVVNYTERERGDLIFYCNSEGTVNHVAIYIGEDLVIEATEEGVMKNKIITNAHNKIKGVKRVFK